jgi:hypothetical protein
MEMIFELLVENVVELVTFDPFCVAVKLIAVPPGSMAKLMFVPRDEVTVSVDAPTVTVALPLKPLYVAVIVTVLVVACSPFTTPELLTVTNVPVVSELSQIAIPVTSFVLPSLKFAIAVRGRVPPIWRLFVEGLTVTELTVGVTKNPVQPAATAKLQSAAIR